MGLTWSWQGLRDSGTLPLSLLYMLGCLCHSLGNTTGSRTPLGHSRDQNQDGMVPCSSQIPRTSCPGTGSDQGLTLCSLLPGSAQARGSVAMLPLFLSPRGGSGSRDTLCGRAGSLIARGCCLSGPRAHSPGPGRGLSPPHSRFPGMPACPGTNNPAQWHSTGCRTWPCGDRQGWGTQMTRVMRRQVTLVVRGCSHLGTCVVRG